MLSLCELFKLPDPKEAREKFDKTVVCGVRHSLCAHSVACLDEQDGSTHAFVPVRTELRGFECAYMKSTDNSWHDVDLRKAVEELLKVTIDALDSVLEKGIRTLYKGQEQCGRAIEISRKLDDLRAIRDRGGVVRSEDGSVLLRSNSTLQ